MNSPTSRSLAHLRSLGWEAAVVERWNQYARVRQDLFGFIDIVALNDGIITFAIQATTTSNIQARVKKILAETRAKKWLRSPFRKILVHGWKKQGKRGERKLWRLTEIEVKL